MANILTRYKTPIATAIVGGVILACTAPASLASDDGKAPRVMTISGNGSAAGEPDVGMINMGVQSDAETAEAALSDNNSKMGRLIDSLKSAGIDKKDIQTSQFNVSPRYARRNANSGYDYSKIIGYSVSNQVHIIVRDLEKFGSILDASVRDGANRMNGISFEFSDPQPLMDKAREAAVEDAIRKAELYANAANVALGDILTLTESYGGTPRPVHAKMMADSSQEAAIAVGESELSANVTITFEID